MAGPCPELLELEPKVRRWWNAIREAGKAGAVRVRELWQLKISDPIEFERRMTEGYLRTRGKIADALKQYGGEVGAAVARLTVGGGVQEEIFRERVKAAMRPLEGRLNMLSFRLGVMAPEGVTLMAEKVTEGKLRELPQDLRALAEEIVALTDEFGMRMERGGLLPKEARESLQGRYVPLMWDPAVRKELKLIEEQGYGHRLSILERVRKLFGEIGKTAQDMLIEEEILKIEQDPEVLRELGIKPEDVKTEEAQDRILRRALAEVQGAEPPKFDKPMEQAKAEVRLRRPRGKGRGINVLEEMKRAGRAGAGRLKARSKRFRELIERGWKITPSSLMGGLEQELRLTHSAVMIEEISKNPEWWFEPPRDKDGEPNLDAVPEGFTYIPKGEDAWMFGKLQGKAVRTEILDRLRDVQEMDSAGWLEWMVTLNSVFKRSAVLARPRAMVNGQILGNVLMMPYLMPYSAAPKHLRWAAAEMAKLLRGEEVDALTKEAFEHEAVWREAGVSAEFSELHEEIGARPDSLSQYLDREAQRNGGKLTMAGILRAMSDFVFDVDFSMGRLEKATKIPGMTVGGGGARVAWWYVDNVFRLGAYRYMRTEGEGGLVMRKLRRERGLPERAVLDPQTASQRIREFYDLRDVPKIIEYARRAPFVGPTFISYPFIAWRQLFARGYAVRDPFATTLWLAIVPMWRAAWTAVSGKDWEEVEDEALLAAGGNERLADKLVPIGEVGGQTYWFNLGAGGGADLLLGVFPWAGVMQGHDPGFFRGLLASNPAGSLLLRLSGQSPYSGRPESIDHPLMRIAGLVTPTTFLVDLVDNLEWHREDLELGREPMSTVPRILLKTVLGLDVRATGAPGTALRSRQRSKALYARLLEEALKAGVDLSARPARPGVEATPEQLEAYYRLTRFLQANR